VDFSDLFVVLREGTAPGPYASLVAAKEAGAVTLNYGVFVNAIISFLIVAFSVFILVSQMNRLRRQAEAPPAEPTTKGCPFCFSTIPVKATRCPFCTSQIPA